MLFSLFSYINEAVLQPILTRTFFRYDSILLQMAWWIYGKVWYIRDIKCCLAKHANLPRAKIIAIQVSLQNSLFSRIISKNFAKKKQILVITVICRNVDIVIYTLRIFIFKSTSRGGAIMFFIDKGNTGHSIIFVVGVRIVKHLNPAISLPCFRHPSRTGIGWIRKPTHFVDNSLCHYLLLLAFI